LSGIDTGLVSACPCLKGEERMDPSRFDRLSKVVAESNSRRRMVQAAVALTLAGIPVLQGDDTDAKRRKKGGVGAEHWNKKKRFYCLNGKTIRRYRRKQEKLLVMGATLGKCGAPCVPTTCKALHAKCGTPPDGCGGTLQCGPCVDPPCTPVTCADLGVQCGTIDDGCGETVTCGPCGTNLVCCSGMCVNTFTNNEHCGQCDKVCAADEYCSGGFCLRL
jgi:hypothetical protein